MKIALDANVIIAAFAARGLCESIMELCLSEHDITLSDDLFDEILRNLRPRSNFLQMLLTISVGFYVSIQISQVQYQLNRKHVVILMT